MKMLINPEGGLAGDMFSAALISAGADFQRMQQAMSAAGKKLGETQIDLRQTPDGSSQLSISLNSQKHHLSESEAVEILKQLFSQFHIKELYRDFGMRILEILAEAEKKAHAKYNIVVEDHSPHPHSHSHPADDHYHHPHHHHHHRHPDTISEQTFLHEAQDIVIDIMGAVNGLQLLNIEPSAILLRPISVGGGQIHFSHGTHSIPAPATTVILEDHRLPWKKGPLDVELLTPTGSAIIAALSPSLDETIEIGSLDQITCGKSRGTKMLEIPPLELYFY